MGDATLALIVAAGAAVATAAQLPVFISRLQLAGVYDVPNARSSHSRVVVRGGGIAMVLPALVGASVIGGSIGLRALIVMALLGLAVTGFLDDLRGLDIKPRFLAQLIAGILAAYAITGVGLLLLPAGLLILATVNAFNFMDGINGLSGATLVVSGVAYGLYGLEASSTTLAVIGFLAAGLGIGFLPFNFPNARVFLGDAGSYLGGGLLGISAVIAMDAGIQSLAALAPIAIYGADTMTTLIRRSLRGEKVGEAHREHTYQRLAQIVGHSISTLATAGLTALLVAISVFRQVLGGTLPQVVLSLVVLALYLLLPGLAQRSKAAS